MQITTTTTGKNSFAKKNANKELLFRFFLNMIRIFISPLKLWLNDTGIHITHINICRRILFRNLFRVLCDICSEPYDADMYVKKKGVNFVGIVTWQKKRDEKNKIGMK